MKPSKAEAQDAFDDIRSEMRMPYTRADVVQAFIDSCPDEPAPSPTSDDAAAYMLIYPGCECGPTETCESVAYQKLAESPAGTELRPVYFRPSPTKPEGMKWDGKHTCNPMPIGNLHYCPTCGRTV